MISRAETKEAIGCTSDKAASPSAFVLVRSAVPKYVIVAVLSWMIAFIALRLDKADFNVLFSYQTGDALLAGTCAKNLIEHSWISENPNLGAPFGQLFYDYPVFDSFNFFTLKLLGKLSGSYAWAVNTYFVLLFPLTGLCCCAVLSALRVGSLPAIVISLVYTALPFRFYRGEHHLFLSAYQVVPLAALVIIWFATWDPGHTSRTALVHSFGIKRSFVSVLIIILIATSGVYYAFFTGFFLVAAATYRSLRSHSMKPIAASAALIIMLIVAGLANIAPSIAFWASNGSGSGVVRSPGEASFYGMRLTSVLMPIPHHRIPPLAALRRVYSTQVPFDDASTSLGAVGSLGLMALLAIPVLPRLPDSRRELLLSLSFLTGCGVLIATTGGFGQIFALLVSPAIRDYGRICPFLAFFALTAIAIGIDLVRQRYTRTAHRMILNSSVVLLGLFAVTDQTSAAFIPDYANAAFELRSDRDFVGRIERRVPANSMLFQLPYVPFPENPPVVRTSDYDFLRGYLNSHTLRWSYGAMKGRFADAWIRTVARRPVPELLDSLSLAGFAGLVVDRFGYVNSETEIERPIRDELGNASVESQNGRFAFYSLRSHTEALKSQLTESEWRQRADRLMKPLYLEWQNGFWSLEGTPAGNHRWCNRTATLMISNPLPGAVEARATTRACSGSPVSSAFQIEGAGLDYSTPITSACTALDLHLKLPPGNTFITFKSDAMRVITQGDPRILRFRLEDFALALDRSALEILQNK